MEQDYDDYSTLSDKEELTRRDQFAMAAFPIVLKYLLDEGFEYADIAHTCYKIADSMEKERAKWTS